jgi:hypothetical protein
LWKSNKIYISYQQFSGKLLSSLQNHEVKKPDATPPLLLGKSYDGLSPVGYDLAVNPRRKRKKKKERERIER